MSLEYGKSTNRLAKSRENTNGKQNHTTSRRDWTRVSEHWAPHRNAAEDVASCASAECHEWAHRFTKEDDWEANR